MEKYPEFRELCNQILTNENWVPQHTQNLTAVKNFYSKIGDFNILTQNSVFYQFLYEIVNLEFLKKSENFYPFKKLPKTLHNKNIIWFFVYFSTIFPNIVEYYKLMN